MTTPFDCALNSVLLSSLNESICVLDIQEDAPKLRITTAAAYGEGQHLLRRERESLTVQVRFAIHEENIARRNEVLRAVRVWAEKGGMLTTSDRPGQQLRVVCTGLPGMSAKDWTEPLTLAFTSTYVPYWEDKEITSVSSVGMATLTTPGTADFAPLDVVVVNNGQEPATRLTIHCDNTRMTFEGISLPADNAFVLLYSNDMLLAWVNGVSVLPCRTADSADLLLAPCGKGCIVHATGDQPLRASFSVRGRYL